MILIACSIVIALSNAISAVYVVRFVRKAIPQIRNIERYTHTMRTDVLLRRRRLPKNS